jgi:glycosyltransferase involved in cell wall biosynthesis
MTQPLISIVTPCLNRLAFVRAAVESVLAQGYPNFEHIVMDGGSTDGTLDILKEYPHLRVVSEPDWGMYDAINKGLGLAHGEIAAWLNTDDVYPPGAFTAAAETFEAHPEAQAISGGAETFELTADGPRVLGTERPIDGVDFWRRIVNSPVPNGWFFKMSLFEIVGYFNPNFRIVADRELIIRIALAGIRPLPVEQALYRYYQHEGSATFHLEDSRHPVYGVRRMASSREEIRLMEGFLSHPDLPPAVRRVMKQANSQYAYRLTATAMYHRRWDLVREGMQAGFRRNPFFPLAFARFALRRLLGRTP